MPDERPPRDVSDYAELDAPGGGEIELKPFALFLQEARKGGLHTEMSERLVELTKQCLKTGKRGKITLTLTLDPNSDGALGPMVKVTDDVTVKAPRPNVPSSHYFADENGNLHRDPPKQLAIPLREISGGRSDAALREAPQPKPREETSPS